MEYSVEFVKRMIDRVSNIQNEKVREDAKKYWLEQLELCKQ